MRKAINVIPAQAGIYHFVRRYLWFPAFAGMTVLIALAAVFAADTSKGAKKKLTLMDLLKKPATSSQRPATVAGVRGLDETSGGIDTKARNYPAIEKLEQVAVHEDELNRFIEEGKLR